ncbi:MAG TPA: Ku protein [Acidimicrobiales bacterium]|jgi:DNA end-binding protein Ku
MPRAIWSGSISFGLVNIPIRLYTAVSRKNVQFHQIDAKSGSRVRMQRVSSADGAEVPYENIVKGYELSPDHYVLVEPEELDALDPEATHTIEIEEFVDLADIDPVFYDSAYFVAPVKAAEKPYALLVRAMEEQQKVAIARFVMRTKQYLAALRPKDGALLVSTMVYADELVPRDEVGELDGVADIDVSDRELAMARQLIDSLATDFDPSRYHDDYREKVLELIERKASGEETVVAAAPAPDAGTVVDLMAALEASVREARESRSRHPAEGDAAKGASSKAPAKSAGSKASTKKAAGKKGSGEDEQPAAEQIA